MSKKKFKAGLESLFGDMGGDDQLPGIRPLLVEEEEVATKSNVTSKRRKRRSSKNFTSDLEDLFHSALEKEYRDVSGSKKMSKDQEIKKRSERPVIGIDALIRRTNTDIKETEGISTPLKKRVTFTLEKHKVEQLKSIAKSKKAYLKDVVDEIISRYLKERTKHQPPTVN